MSVRVSIDDDLFMVTNEGVTRLAWPWTSQPITTQDDSGAAEDTAAVVAVLRASWAWDESEEFDVAVLDQRYRVQPKYDGLNWSATVVAADTEVLQ